jgi:hypothetical protein
MSRKLLFSVILFLMILILLVPNKDDYFLRIAKDYGSNHQSVQLTPEDLMKLGDFEYQNRFLYSHFEYQFGNISVSYYGFLSFIIFEKSEFKEQKSLHITV